MNRKAQLTIFVIIGLALLLGIAAYLYYSGFGIGEPEIITEETMPVRNFVDNCIEAAAREGIQTIGFNGGYIYFPDPIKNNPMSYLQTSPIDELRNPYWWYQGNIAIPPEDLIRAQISDYVKENLKECAGDFAGFNEFEVREIGEIETFTQLNKKDVTVKAKYPLLLKYRMNGTKVKLKSDYSVNIPIRLKKAYETAKRIMERENEEYFVEEKAIDLMAMDDEIPITGVEVTCKTKTWEVPKVRKKLKRLLEVNLPYIRIENTDYNQASYVPSPYSDNDYYNESYYWHHYLWDIGLERDENIHVSFSYDQTWPMDFYVRPNNGMVMTSNAQQGSDMLSWFCLHIWHFTYDLKFPVKATLYDEATDDNEAYRFSFAFMANIDHNKPVRYNYGTSIFDGKETLSDEEFCEDVKNEVTIFTLSNSSQKIEDTADVNLTFICGRYECDLGKSGWISYGAAAGFQEKLPYCVMGIIKGEKKGFQPNKMFIQTDKERSYNLYMNPVVEVLNYSVVKHSSANPASEFKLESDEQAAIMIDTPMGKRYGLRPSGLNTPLTFLAEEERAYDLQIFLMSGDDIVGGYKADWQLGPEDLEGLKEIRFHVIEQEPLPEEELERYEFLASLEDHSKDIPEPELIK